jgi:hypothetical protein
VIAVGLVSRPPPRCCAQLTCPIRAATRLLRKRAFG